MLSQTPIPPLPTRALVATFGLAFGLSLTEEQSQAWALLAAWAVGGLIELAKKIRDRRAAARLTAQDVSGRMRKAADAVKTPPSTLILLLAVFGLVLYGCGGVQGQVAGLAGPMAVERVVATCDAEAVFRIGNTPVGFLVRPTFAEGSGEGSGEGFRGTACVSVGFILLCGELGQDR